MTTLKNEKSMPTNRWDRRFYQAAWRWHFYAGLYVVPFLMVLAITGMTMMLIGYIDGRDGEKITVSVPQDATPLSLLQQAENAKAAVPGGKLIEWIKAPAADRVNVFRIENTDAEQLMVAVNPYTGDIVERWSRRQGWYDFADSIHSDLMLGTTGDRLLEIAAGFGIVLIVTGLYLWWPRNRSLRATLIPNLTAKGRNFWKELHLLIGLYGSAFFLLFLLSGMSWTGVWGSKLVQPWSTFPAEKWNNVPLSDETHASMNHGTISDVPWALEQTPMPASGSDAGTAGTRPGEVVNLDSIEQLAQRIGFAGRYRVAFPAGSSGVWTVNQDTMSADAQNPFGDRTVHIDQYTGKVLAHVAFADYSLAGKTMAVSIPLHMGLVTIWNLLANLLLCLSIIVLSLSGVVMWWKRRPKKAGFRLCAPKAPDNLPHWRSAMTVMLLLSLAFPLVGITLVSVLLLDWLILSRIPVLNQAFS